MRKPKTFYNDRDGMKKAIRNGTYFKMTRKHILEEFVKPLLKEIDWREYANGVSIETNQSYHRIMIRLQGELTREPGDDRPWTKREMELIRLYRLKDSG